MRRISLVNLAWGFLLIFMAACGGAFVALRTTESFMSGAMSPSWQAVLEASSHGHTSLFGVIHILFGLTIPYVRSPDRVNVLKSIGLFLGSIAMGPLLLVRASLGPTLSTELNGVVIGSFLALAMLALFSHAMDLFWRVLSRA